MLQVQTGFNNKSFKRLFTNSLNYGIGDFIAQLVGFLLIPLYTRYLSPTDYGIIELTAILSAFIVPLMKFGLPGSVTRHYYDYVDNPSELKNYITTINLLLNWLAILSGAVILVLLYFIGNELFPGLQFWPFMVIAVISAGLGANNQLQQKLMQNREQSRYSMLLKIAFTIFSISMSVLFVVVFRLGAIGIVAVSLLTSFVFFIQAAYYLRGLTNGRFSKSMAREGISYGVGILPHHLSATAAPLINTTLLINIGSIASLGLYSIALRFFLPLEFIYSAVNTAFIPMYNSYRKANDNENLRGTVRQILTVSLLVYVLFQFFAPSIMKWMVPANYESAIALVPILAVAFIGKTVYSICVAEIFYSKKTKFISIITFAGLLTNTLVCILLVQSLEAKAISWGFSIGFCIWGAAAYFYKRKISNHEMYNKELLLFLFLSGIFTTAAFWINYFYLLN